MDVIRLCANGHFAKRECILQCTPDEAATLGALLSHAAAEWLNESEEYQGFIADNDR